MDTFIDLCADCDASAPNWASLNRGVLLCDECSSIHRQLGRHVSQIKHLKKSRWRTTQLDMVHYLVSAGANRYWEHVLYEPMLSGKRPTQQANATTHTSAAKKKPRPTDPLHPIKVEFIREKYLFLGFFKKPRNINQDDLNQQLHASVRTGVLETSLYLLALGADPNFVHPSKGTAPMHVASQYNQVGQVEVLLAYGADVCIRDSWGQTPIDVALERAISANGNIGLNDTSLPLTVEQKLRFAWSSLVDTLVNAYYEITDSLAYFLCRAVPDHKLAVLGQSTSDPALLPTRTDSPKKMFPKVITNNKPESTRQTFTNGHFLISTSILQNGVHDVKSKPEVEDWTGKARSRLRQLPNLAFEDLCIDVYDEADRRLTNSFLESLDYSTSEQKLNGLPSGDGYQQTRMTSHTIQSLTLYFLPPNTTYSSVRNQARQKLGRLSTVEFHTLVLDILTEVSVRLLPLFPPINLMQSVSHDLSVQQHVYSTYFPSDVPKESMPSSVSARLTPLPSPPLVETELDADHLLSIELATEPTTPVTNVSSSPSVCETDGKGDSVPGKIKDDLVQKPLTNRGGGKHLAGVHRSDDPVYDQVAAESDINSLSTNSSSAAPFFSTLNSSPVVTNHQKHGLPLADIETEGNVECSAQSISPAIFNDTLAFSVTPDPSITSCPGPVPGSRRLHLPHTGRITQHRASVPSAHATSMKQFIDFSLSPVLEVANLSSESIPQSHAHSTNSQKESHSKCQPEPCCVAARNEVDRLRRENSELRSQLVEIQADKKLLEARLKNLEDRIEQADSFIASLTNEKNALQSTLNASAITRHKSSETTHVTGIEEAVQIGEHKPSLRPTIESVFNKPILKRSAEDVRNGDKTSESGNYSVGSQCLDSGIMLRQGIVLRSNRGGSPASVNSQSEQSSSLSPTPVSLPTKPPEVACRRTCETTGSVIVTKSVTSCVNLPRLMPKPAVKTVSVNKPPHGALAVAQHWNALGASATTSYNYVAPNSTGTPSPAPLPTTPLTPSPSHADQNQIDLDRSISMKALAPDHPSITQCGLQKQHDWKMASTVALSDSNNSTGGTKDSRNCLVAATAKVAPSSETGWQGPSSEQVVRCVEVIIVRIRNLVQLANGERPGDFIGCSLAIEYAVQDILRLFPSSSHRPSKISIALSELASGSQCLQPHCEQMARKLPTSTAVQHDPQAAVPNVNAVIRHAHRIAKAAKELLSFFQRTA